MKYKIIILSLIMFTSSLRAQEPERIIDFHSDIHVVADGSMVVMERIQVVSTGDQIRRGIYRDFPTRYKTPDGKWYVVEFNLQEVFRDGYPEEYHTEDMSNGVRIYIGNANVYLEPGTHTYSITYRTYRQIGFFNDYDELYWNVTGNGWKFTIEKASAIVKLPLEIRKRIIAYDGYTGYTNSRGKDFLASVNHQGEVSFETISPLMAEQGLTIVINWPKGLIAEPTFNQKVNYFYQDNLPLLIGIVGCLVILLYYVFDWLKVGKDPEKGSIYPIYQPPEGLSPAAIRYIRNKGYDDKALTAALINIAVKGHINISEDKDVFSISRKANNEKNLSTEEADIVGQLFKFRDQIQLKNTNHTIISRTVNTIKNSLKNQYQHAYFRTNRKYFIIGAIISAVVLIVNLFAFPDKAVIGVAIWLTGWSVGVGLLLFVSINAWRAVWASKSKRSLFSALFMTLFSLPFIAGEVLGLILLAQTTSLPWIILFLAIIFINILFYRLLEAYTPIGRSLMDRVEGFRMFLSVTERDRIRMLNPHARSIELFEKYLPYAIALDVEQEWSDQFTDILAQSGQQQPSRVASWYSSSSSRPVNIGSLMSSLGSSFSASISSSSSAPGSRSGSGGGGSSGGGGGGGGGGGW
ncbi:DUF2207 domain-containing protein [candidate division KSB1 bacterium]|nr:DUF2207 domain-containing protein [candidate division KSB1 bacterium]